MSRWWWSRRRGNFKFQEKEQRRAEDHDGKRRRKKGKKMIMKMSTTQAKDGAMKMDDHADDHNPKFYYKKDGTKLLRSLTPSLPTSSCYYVSSCKSKGWRNYPQVSVSRWWRGLRGWKRAWRLWRLITALIFFHWTGLNISQYGAGDSQADKK